MRGRFNSIIGDLAYAKGPSDLLKVAIPIENIAGICAKRFEMDAGFLSHVFRVKTEFVIVVIQIYNLLAAYDGLPIQDALPGERCMFASGYVDVRNFGLRTRRLHTRSLSNAHTREGYANAPQDISFTF